MLLRAFTDRFNPRYIYFPGSVIVFLNVTTSALQSSIQQVSNNGFCNAVHSEYVYAD